MIRVNFIQTLATRQRHNRTVAFAAETDGQMRENRIEIYDQTMLSHCLETEYTHR